MNSRPRRGLSMVELLVAVAIVGLLVSLLLPAVQSSRGSARRVVCQSNLRQLGLATLQFHASQGHFPDGLRQKKVRWSPQYRGNSLFTYLLPHLEEGRLLQDWDYERPLENANGGERAATAAQVSVFLCPDDTLAQNPIAVADRYFGMTSYGGNGGTQSFPAEQATLDGIFHTTGAGSEPMPDQVPVSRAMVKDGTSNTVLFGERSHSDPNLQSFADAHWADSLQFVGRWAAIGGRKRIGDVTLSALVAINFRVPMHYEERELANPPISNRLDFEPYEHKRICAFGSHHTGGANFVFADGSVRFLEDATNLATLRALLHPQWRRNDKQVMPLPNDTITERHHDQFHVFASPHGRPVARAKPHRRVHYAHTDVGFDDLRI